VCCLNSILSITETTREYKAKWIRYTDRRIHTLRSSKRQKEHHTSSGKNRVNVIRIVQLKDNDCNGDDDDDNNNNNNNQRSILNRCGNFQQSQLSQHHHR